MNRRVVLSVLAAGGVTALLWVVPFKSLVGRPRFSSRKRGRRLFFPKQRLVLYVNRKSGSIRYSRWEHIDPTVSKLKLTNYEPVPLDEVLKRMANQRHQFEFGGPHGLVLDLVREETILEEIALEAVRERKFDEARKFLWFHLNDEAARVGFGSVWSDVRLNDLLAGLTVRFGTQADYEAFLQSTSKKEAPWEAKEQEWQDRLAKWKNQNGKWFKRWKDRQKQVIWAGLLM